MNLPCILRQMIGEEQIPVSFCRFWTRKNPDGTYATNVIPCGESGCKHTSSTKSDDKWHKMLHDGMWSKPGTQNNGKRK